MPRVKEQKGITLVALVITIVIMLILAGVIISVSLNGGLFSTANEATAEMQIDIEKEQLLTAALRSVGRNGKINFSDLDNNLPENFTKISEGKYESSTGNKYQVTEDVDVILLDGTEEEPEEPVTPPTITLSTRQISKEITNGISETVSLTATLNNASGNLTWTSSNPSVAEISGSGTTRTITLKQAGTATITVSYGDVSATCSITITEKPISVVLDKETINETIESGGTKTVSLTATLNNASGDLTWISSNPSVAEISGSGITRTITLKKAGTATITASYGTASDTCSITVTENGPAQISFTIAGTTYYAEDGMTWGEWVESDYNTANAYVGSMGIAIRK